MANPNSTTNDGLIRETTTLAEVKYLNPHLDWSSRPTAGLPDDALVDVVRRDTPWGRYLLAVRPHTP